MRRGCPGQEAPSNKIASSSLVPTDQLDDIESACTACIVLLVSRSGKRLRKPYLSLHSAQAALQRAQERGQPARLVLCRLVPVAADLELTGERAS